jgi:hypothetical protein
MTEIREAQVVLYYLFDVAETIDLALIQQLIAGPATEVRLAPRQPTPAYVQYDKPPVSFDGSAVGTPELDGFAARVRVYDYGVLSLCLTRGFKGSWSSLVGLGQTLVENADLERRAEEMCRTIAERLRPALNGFRDTRLSEDYLVYVVHELAGGGSAADVLEAHGDEIAGMLRGERQPLSDEERSNILRHRISYLADDLVVPSWNAAFVYDTQAGAQTALEILEFANSQLLEYRYFDDRLDAELETIYASVQHPRWYDQWLGSRYTRAARQVHALFIDVTELTDRTSNALKFTGDIYAARLFALVRDRLGLATWKADVEAKLQTLNDIYRFAVEQSSMARGQLLELTIVLILVFELVLFFAGIMQ